MHCPNCQTPVSPDQRFCEVCGTSLTPPIAPSAGSPSGLRSTLGGDRPAPNGPPSPGQGGPPVAGGVPPTGSGSPQSTPGMVPTVTVVPAGPPVPPVATGQTASATPGQGRGTAMKLLVLVGVIALVAVGVWFAKGLLVGTDGAKSPEAAVQQLADAIDSEDPAGVALALAPDEVRGLGDVVDAVETQAKKSGFTGKKSTYGGVDIEVDDLELDTEELGPDAARVTIRRGEIGYRTKGSELAEPVRALIASNGDESGRTSSRSFEDDTGVDLGRDPYLVTVKRDGGWYVSLTYTVADYLVRSDDRPEGDFDHEPKEKSVAEEPEEAVVAFAESVGNIDLDETSASVSQPEWSVLHAYRNAIEDVIDEQQDEGNLNDVRFEVDDTDLRVEDLSGDAKKVVIEGASGSARWRGYDGEERSDWRVRKGCLEIDDEGPDCLDNGTYLTRHLDLEDAFVVVTKERGGWAVSPMSTAIEYAKLLVPKMSAPVVLSFLGRPDLIAPKGRLDAGKPVEVKLDEAGYATYTLAPSAPKQFVLTSADLDDASVYDEDGEPVYGDYLDNGVLLDLQDQTYRVVASREDYDGGRTGTLSLTALRVEDLPSSGAASGRLTTAQPVIDYRFRVPDDVQRSLVVTEGDVDAVIVDGGGEEICYADPDSSCDFVTGEDYRVRVLSYGEFDGDEAFSLELREQTSNVDGSPAVDGVIDGSPGYHTIHVPAGTTATVTVSSGDFDADFEIDGESFQDVGDQTVTVTGPADVSLTVYAYPSGSTGSYTVTVED